VAKSGLPIGCRALGRLLGSPSGITPSSVESRTSAAPHGFWLASCQLAPHHACYLGGERKIAVNSFAEDTVSASPSHTGLPNAIKIIPGNPAHGPCIKVALNPIDRFSVNGDSAYIPFGETPGSFGKPRPRRAGGLLPSDALLRQLHDFIELNRADFFAFDRDPDQGGISGAEVMRRLRKLPPKL
jgi:hypothetical protein